MGGGKIVSRYANSRMGITVLGIVAWGHGMSREYFTYMSRVKTQSALFVQACLEDLLERLPSAAVQGSGTKILLSDRGTHFKARGPLPS